MRLNVFLPILIFVVSHVTPSKAQIVYVDLDFPVADTQNCTVNPLVVPVRAKTFFGPKIVRFSINWNPSLLKLDSVSAVNPQLITSEPTITHNITAGWLTFNMTATAGQVLLPNSILFSLHFKIKGQGNDQISINYSDFPLQRFAELINGTQVPVITNNKTFNAYDINPPTVNCPNNMQLYVGQVCQTAQVNWNMPFVQDPCDPNPLQIFASHTPPISFAPGAHLVAYTYQDASGNTGSCNFTVSVSDTIRPTIICPNNTSINVTPGKCFRQNFTLPNPLSTTDNCSVSSVSGSLNGASAPPGNQFNLPVGNNIVVYNVTDASGNTRSCSYTITVIDNEPPVIANCPANIVTYAPSNTCARQVSWVVPTTSDNCVANPTLTGNFSPGQLFLPGIYQVTYNSVANGLSAVPCSFSITVLDTVKPVVQCPANQTLTAGTGCVAQASPIQPLVSDNCNIQSMVSSLANNTPLPLGQHQVSWVVKDSSGNSASCTYVISVVDSSVPTISCPGNVNVTATPACTAQVVLPNAVAEDCSQVTVTASPNTTQFGIGQTTVVYKATDANGLTATCSVTVTVIDQTPPVIASCPAHLTVNTNPGICSGTANWSPPSASDCGGQVTLTASSQPGSFAIGTHTITYTAQDPSGNTSTCTFAVTVKDTEAPVWSNCPSQVSVGASSTTCGSVVTWPVPTATDNCGGNPIIVSSHNPGQFFNIGTYTVSLTATDASNNTSTCSFTVSVIEASAPAFSFCPSNIAEPFVVNADCSGSYTLPEPTPVPGCFDVLTNNLPPNNTFPIGLFTVQYVLTDVPTGQTATCSFTANFVDQTPPQITNCPNSITLPANTNCKAIVNWPPLQTIENCSMPVSVTSSHQSGSTFNLGTTLVTLTATDAVGNVSTCTFNVIVKDQTAPAITNCPANQTVQAGTNCTALAQWPPISATDNCSASGSISIATSVNVGSVLNVGVHVINVTATDQAGNSSTCSFTFTVKDQAPPVISNCPNNIVLPVGNSCQVVANWPIPNVTDQCDSNPTLNSNVSPNTSVLSVGQSLQVTYTASDISGNTATPCTFTVTAKDVTPPVFLTNDTIYISSSGAIIQDQTGSIISATPISCDTMLVVYSLNSSVADNCGVVSNSVISGPPSGGVFKAGYNYIVSQASDAAGNVTTHQMPVVIVSVPQLVSLTTGANQCVGTNVTLATGLSPVGLSYSWVGPNGFTSSLSAPNLSITQASAGVYSVTVTDLANCTGSGSLTIVAYDFPVLTVGSDTIPCYGGPLALTATSSIPNVTWEWTTPNGTVSNTQNYENPQATAGNAGNYSVKACNNVCCTTASVQVGVSQFIPDVVLNAQPQPVCIGEEVLLTAQAPSGTQFQWSSVGGGLQGPTNLAQVTAITQSVGTANYDLTANLPGCMPTTVSIAVPVVSAQISSVGATGIEPCELPGSTALLQVNGNQLVSASWAGPNGFTGSGVSTVLAINSTAQVGTYSVTVTDANGCVATSSTSISYGITPPAPVVVYGPGVIVNPAAGQPGEPNIYGCPGSSISLNVNASADLSYLWVGPNGLSVSQPQLDLSNISSNHEGIYAVFANSNGCVSEPTNVVLDFIETPVAQDDQFTIPAQKDSTVLYVSSNDQLASGGTTYNLLTQPLFGYITGEDVFGSFVLQNDTTYGGAMTFTYEICSDICPTVCDEAEVYVVQVIPCIVPNLITPNEDGYNDALVVGCLQFEGRHPDSELHIYNEWGDRVYDALNYKNDWKGTNSRGDNLPDGVYFYIFREDPSVEWKKGYLHIMRGK